MATAPAATDAAPPPLTAHELREVGPGLYLGPAMWRSGDDHTTILYFAIDHNG